MLRDLNITYSIMLNFCHYILAGVEMNVASPISTLQSGTEEATVLSAKHMLFMFFLYRVLLFSYKMLTPSKPTLLLA